jgi:nucleoside-diphosphate-sugar epimerase
MDEVDRILAIDSVTDYYDVEIKKRNVQTLDADKIDFVSSDISRMSDQQLGDLFQDAKYIFHQAGQPGVRASWGREFDTYLSSNVTATQRLLEAAKDSKSLEKFVYASSSSIYGDQPKYPVTEESLPMPRSPYGVTKLAAENLVSLYASNYSIPTISLRYFTVYGPGQRPDMAFTRFLTWILRGDIIQVYGNGRQIREFTYVDDIVDANISAAFKSTPNGLVANVCGGASVALHEVLEEMQEITGRRAKVQHLETVRGDVMQTGGRADIARELLEWTPKVGLTAGLREQSRWVSEVADLLSGAIV